MRGLEFYMNPAHRKALANAVTADSLDAIGVRPLGGIPFTFSPYIPERKTRKEWRPPAGDRFCEYGPEDEAWMRDLGLGYFVEVDEGPVFYAIDWDQLFRAAYRPLMPLFGV